MDMSIETLKEFLATQGYFDFKEIEGKGLCALRRFIFTTGLVVGLNEFVYESRYCYQHFSDARRALNEWDGTGDPSYGWIKHKGDGPDRVNPDNNSEY